MNVFDLAAVLTLDKSGYDSGLDDAEQEASGFGDKLKKGFGTAAKVAGAVIGTAASAGAGIVKMASSSASAMDEIDKASQKMGVSVEAYQEWKHAMDLSGMSIDTMKNGMKTLQTAISKNDEVFSDMGISITDASGNLRSSEDIMNEAIIKLSDMEDGAERAALANKLFGRAGVEMAPLLNAGSEAINGMKKEAHDLGLVMSGDDVKAGAKLNDTLGNLKQSFNAIITRVGTSLMPIIQKVADSLLKFMPRLQEMFDRFAPMLLDFADQVLPFLMDLAEALLPTIFDILETVMPLLQSLVRAVLPIVETALKAINPLLQLLASLLKPVLDIVNLLLKPLLDLVNWVFGGVIDGFNGVADSLGENGFIGLLGGLAETIGDVFGWIGTLFDDPAEALKKAFQGVYDFAKNIFEGIGDFVSGVFQAIDLNMHAGERAEEVQEQNLDFIRKNLQRGINEKDYDWLQKTYAQVTAADYGGLSAESKEVIRHEFGTLRIEGVNSEGQMIAAANYTLEQLAIDSRR